MIKCEGCLLKKLREDQMGVINKLREHSEDNIECEIIECGFAAEWINNKFRLEREGEENGLVMCPNGQEINIMRHKGGFVEQIV